MVNYSTLEEADIKERVRRSRGSVPQHETVNLELLPMDSENSVDIYSGSFHDQSYVPMNGWRFKRGGNYCINLYSRRNMWRSRTCFLVAGFFIFVILLIGLLLATGVLKMSRRVPVVSMSSDTKSVVHATPMENLQASVAPLPSFTTPITGHSAGGPKVEVEPIGSVQDSSQTPTSPPPPTTLVSSMAFTGDEQTNAGMGSTDELGLSEEWNGTDIFSNVSEEWFSDGELLIQYLVLNPVKNLLDYLLSSGAQAERTTKNDSAGNGTISETTGGTAVPENAMIRPVPHTERESFSFCKFLTRFITAEGRGPSSSEEPVVNSSPRTITTTISTQNITEELASSVDLGKPYLQEPLPPLDNPSIKTEYVSTSRPISQSPPLPILLPSSSSSAILHISQNTTGDTSDTHSTESSKVSPSPSETSVNAKVNEAIVAPRNTSAPATVEPEQTVEMNGSTTNGQLRSLLEK